VRVARRPSKFALWRMLEADLRDATGAVGLDAACAAFKTYPLFRTDRYYGVDVDRAAIEEGRRTHPEAVGVLGDLVSLDLPRRSVDVCVSTNTLHWMYPEDRREVERRLVDLVRPDGTLIVECERNDMLAGLLAHVHAEFDDVDVRYFGSWMARKYEAWLKDRSALEWRKGPMRTVRMGVAMVLSWVELVAPHAAFGRGYVYIRARRRKDRSVVNEFVVDPARLIADGVYAAS
jgi:SAM-dependent methyltransferase